jgi:20S proteasome subunit beta 2
MQDGVVLGADTRATEGETVCDKNCEKIHYIADNIWCCGAGTSADTEATTQLVSSQIELHRLATGKAPRTITAMTMLKRKLFQYQGHISAALVLGGFDCNGPSLYTVRARSPRLTVAHFHVGVAPLPMAVLSATPTEGGCPDALSPSAPAARSSLTARQTTFPT